MAKVASPPTVLREIRGPEACEICGTQGLKTELVRDPFIYGVGDDAVELVIEIPVHTCAQCEMSFTGEEAEVIEHKAVCRHLGLLTPEEVRELRERHGLSRADFADLTGLGAATIARWERGDVLQNRANDRFLRLLRDPAILHQLRLVARGMDARLPSMPASRKSSERRRRARSSPQPVLTVLPVGQQTQFGQRGGKFSLRRSG